MLLRYCLILTFEDKLQFTMKTVLITGASRGIGYATVQYFLKEGWRVLACSRNLKPLVELKAEHGDTLIDIELDLLDEEHIKRASDIIIGMSYRIDVLIHNAGYLVNKPFDQLNMEDMQNCYQVNAIGPAIFTQYIYSMLSSTAHVVAISSMGGFQGSMKFAGLSAYSSSKAAMACLIECWQEEFKGSQQSFNCLCIGSVQTEMLAEAFPGYESPLQPEDMAAYIYTFSTQSNRVLRGKVIPVSLTNP